MREILPGILWIGNARDLRDVRAVLDAGIETVIDLALEEPPAVFPRDVVHARFPIHDGGGNDPTILRTAIQTLASFVAAKRPTLIACSMGMSRSPAVAATAIAATQDVEPDEALRVVTADSVSDVSASLWLSIRSLMD